MSDKKTSRFSVRWKCLSVQEDISQHSYFVWNNNDPDSALLYSPLSNELLLLGEFDESLLENNIWVRTCLRLLSNKISLINNEKELAGNTSSAHYSIGLSQRCNLNCQYCHAEATGANITNELCNIELDRICDFIVDNSYNHKMVSVSFSCGGEPTIEWEKLTRIVDKLRSTLIKNNISLSLSMTTNGIYGNKRREYISENFSSVTLSLDGTSDIQNKQRPLLSGKGSFEKVMETAKYFKKHGLSFGIRSTVCRDGIDDMKKFVEYVSKYLSPIVVAFEPVVQIGRGASLLDSTFVDPLRFCDAYWEAYCVGKALRVDVRTSMLNMKQVRHTFCGAMAIPSISFSPSGRITGCHRDVDGKYSYGHIDPLTKEIQIDSELLEKIKEASSPPDTCDECFCRWTCAGDCPDIRDVTSRCDMIRELTYRSLLEKTV